MGWKRAVLRRVPIVRKLVDKIEQLEDNCRQLEGNEQQLKSVLSQLIFTDPDSEKHERVRGEELPVPPPHLRYLVAGTEDLDWFLTRGRAGAQTVLDVLGRHGVRPERVESLLDFGCGCGRVLRHLAVMKRTRLHGTDVNAWAIRWCSRHLPFGSFVPCNLKPPLPYSDASFDVMYAFSVFTHFPQALQGPWMDECRRVLKPGGLLLVTFMGSEYLKEFTPAECALFQSGQLVTRESGLSGSNFCGAYHPEEYVRGVLARDFTVLEKAPNGSHGMCPQDLYVMRKR